MLPDGRGWLAGEGYYFLSTTYMLLAPATTFRLLQRRLTDIDLSLEPTMRNHYELLKLVFLSFNEDFDIARQAPKLPYEPDKTDQGEPDRARLLAEAPARYARQGLYRGVLDIVVEALIVEDGGGQRVMSFGEFLREWGRPDSKLDAVHPILRDLILGFHPERKPVLWRVLLVQHMLYTVLLRDEPLSHPLPPPSAEDLPAFDWRRAGEDAASDEAVRAPVFAAHAYVSAKLADVAARTQAPTAPRTSPR